MSQIFDKKYYTRELTYALWQMKRQGITPILTTELLTPSEFFSILEKVSPVWYEYTRTQFTVKPVEINRCNSITNAIKRRIPLPIPYITPEAIPNIFPVDGCHRMYVCEKLFELNTKFPVLILTALKISDEKEITYAKNRYN